MLTLSLSDCRLGGGDTQALSAAVKKISTFCIKLLAVHDVKVLRRRSWPLPWWSLADPKETPGARSLLVQFLSFSCIFLKKNWPNIRLAPPAFGVPDPPWWRLRDVCLLCMVRIRGPNYFATWVFVFLCFKSQIHPDQNVFKYLKRFLKYQSNFEIQSFCFRNMFKISTVCRPGEKFENDMCVVCEVGSYQVINSLGHSQKI